MSPRMRKYIKLLQTPACWPALLHGVAATLEHDAALRNNDFATVIDVGANKGQFAVYARVRWPHARLICFEPLPAPRAKLARVTRGQAEIHHCALGAEPGEGRMHIASRADSSSLLALGARQKTIYGIEAAGELRVPIKRLDAFLLAPLPRPSLLKIDVQGFELEVLKGATTLLPYINAVYVEVSYVELYEGQALHKEVARFLTATGFDITGRYNTHMHHGEQIQEDILFRRALRTQSDSARQL
jgi:FkbM family methyltransferase